MTDSLPQEPHRPEVAQLVLYDGICGLCSTLVIARNRSRVFGRFEPCLAPRPDFRGRFVE